MIKKITKLFISLMLLASLFTFTLPVSADSSRIKTEEELETIRNKLNNKWSGKSLGTSVTEDQWLDITYGTFDNSFGGIGDYWTINGVIYRIASFDYYYNVNGNTEHSIIVVPDTAMGTGYMNSSNVNATGYLNSYFRTTTLATLRSTIANVFGSEHLLEHQITVSSAMQNNATSVTWTQTTSYGVELMSVAQVYGAGDLSWFSTNMQRTYNTYGFRSPDEDDQFPLFKYNMNGEVVSNACAYWDAGTSAGAGAWNSTKAEGPNKGASNNCAANTNTYKSYWWWTNSGTYSTLFAVVEYSSLGGLNLTGASNSGGSFRPAISLKGYSRVNVASETAEGGNTTGTGQYLVGDSVTLSATASNGYRFIKWSNGKTSNPYKFTAKEDITITPIFEKMPTASLNLVVTPTNLGVISSVAVTPISESSYTVTLVATPINGSSFVSWSDGSTENPHTITVTGDASLTATFTK